MSLCLFTCPVQLCSEVKQPARRLLSDCAPCPRKPPPAEAEALTRAPCWRAATPGPLCADGSLLEAHAEALPPFVSVYPAESCPAACDPTDGSPPGFPVPGILQAGNLEWAAISSSRVFPTRESNPRLLHSAWTLHH